VLYTYTAYRLNSYLYFICKKNKIFCSYQESIFLPWGQYCPSGIPYFRIWRDWSNMYRMCACSWVTTQVYICIYACLGVCIHTYVCVSR
jgi:hypothetical protein